jgi:hypothetical protein
MKPKPLTPFETFVKHWGFIPFVVVTFIPAIPVVFITGGFEDIPSLALSTWVSVILITFILTLIFRNKVTIREQEIIDYENS